MKKFIILLTAILLISLTINASPENEEKNYFTSWEEIMSVKTGYAREVEIKLGDLDGDGDLDVIVAYITTHNSNSNGKVILRIYENRMSEEIK